MCIKNPLDTKHFDSLLRIKDPKLNQKFREHRISQFDLPFALYIFLEAIFMFYRSYQTEVGAGDWDMNTESINATIPTKEQRFIYALYACFGWGAIFIIYLLAKSRWNWLYDVICGGLMLNLVVYQYLYMPFDPSRVREFCFWAIILQFRCTLIVTFFRMNGAVDLLLQLVFSVPVFVIHGFKLVEIDNWIWLPAPILITTIGLVMYNYIAAREQSTLFLLERVSNQQNEEQLQMIDMLPGFVFIIDRELQTVLFRNQKDQDIDWLTDSQNQVDEHYKFKLVPYISLQAERKDAIRLKEYPDEEANDLQENVDVYSFIGIIQQAIANDNTVTCCRMDKELYYQIKIQMIHFRGEEAVLIFLQDITALQLLREKETRDRLTTMYSANVSHEMRTPLSTCINFTDLLLASEANLTKRKHLEIIKFSAVMMLNNVNDNLDNAQIQRGTFTPRELKCQLMSALMDVAKVIEMQAASKNIKLEQEVPRFYLLVDKQRVQQVCMNLLSNACKFTSDGLITVKAWVESIDQVRKKMLDEKIKRSKLNIEGEPQEKEPEGRENRDRARLYVQVSDTGCGMKETDINKLFKDFCTLKSNAHLNPNGVGLGLSICKKICLNLDGDIKVSSKVGQGSIFTFYVACDILDEVTGSVKQSTDVTSQIQQGVLSNPFNSQGHYLNGCNGPNELVANDNSLPSEFSHLVNRMHQVFQQFKLQDSLQNELIQSGDNHLQPQQAEEMTLGSQKQVNEPKVAIGPRTVVDPMSMTRILCVDDQIFNIEFLRCQLELMPNLQGRCDYADNGQHTIDLVAKNISMCRSQNPIHSYYTLILLDYSMPQMDGPTTAREILKLYQNEVAEFGRAPPKPHIVCLTAFTEKIFENNARDAGMNGFVSKPITNAKLKQILKEQRLISLAEQIMEM